MNRVNASGAPIQLQIEGPVKPEGKVVMRAVLPTSTEIQPRKVYTIVWKVTRGELSLPRACEGKDRTEAEDMVYGDELFTGHHVLFDAKGLAAGDRLKLEVLVKGDEKDVGHAEYHLDVDADTSEEPPELPDRKPVDATLSRTLLTEQDVQALFFTIRTSTEALSFPSFAAFMDDLFCLSGKKSHRALVGSIAARRALPFPGVDPYRLLKAAAEAFLVINCCVSGDEHVPADEERAEKRYELDASLTPPKDLQKAVRRYLRGTVDGQRFQGMLPYLALIRSKLPEVNILNYLEIKGERCDNAELEAQLALCVQDIQVKQSMPCFIELIWSYWHEEAMLVQAMNAISTRFQNRRLGGGRDPLANLEIDFLRPLGNLLWGYIQDEQHRLSVLRRAYEYEHHYGLSLHGRAVSDLSPADRRSKFLEAFHNLLYRCIEFFRQDDDKTVVADAFPVLNSIKETHYVLGQGAHNQFGDLPATARQEMLIEQWLLARPEMREFLGGRLSVPYPEDWMDRADTMKTLQVWSDVSVVHFHDLAVFGEQILLGIRYHSWSLENDPKTAVAWARYWRSQIQGYIHAYRVVTGIDLTADVTDAQALSQRYLAPSVHLRKRLALQKAG
jgi:hypothetical protein